MKIAVIDDNTLTGIGLQHLLQDMLQNVEIEMLTGSGGIRDMEEGGENAFAHYFVASRIFFEHAAFFRGHPDRTIGGSGQRHHAAAQPRTWRTGEGHAARDATADCTLVEKGDGGGGTALQGHDKQRGGGGVEHQHSNGDDASEDDNGEAQRTFDS